MNRETRAAKKEECPAGLKASQAGGTGINGIKRRDQDKEKTPAAKAHRGLPG